MKKKAETLKTKTLKKDKAITTSSFSLSAFHLPPPMRIRTELRKRTKSFASLVVRTFIQLPRKREEVAVLGKQMFRAGTSVAAHARETSRARSDAELCSKLDGLL